jgi:hypothetical protein
MMGTLWVLVVRPSLSLDHFASVAFLHGQDAAAAAAYRAPSVRHPRLAVIPPSHRPRCPQHHCMTMERRSLVCVRSQEATSPLAAAEAARADKGTTATQQQHEKEARARSVEWGGGPGVGGETMALPSAAEAEAEAAVRSEATWVTGRWVDTTGGGEDRTLDRFGWMFEVIHPA